MLLEKQNERYSRALADARRICSAEHLSKSTYHNLKKRGLGPEELVVPGSRIIRITAESRQRWHERMDRAKSEAAQLEAERRRELALLPVGSRRSHLSMLADGGVGRWVVSGNGGNDECALESRRPARLASPCGVRVGPSARFCSHVWMWGFSGVNRGQIMNLPLPEVCQALIESHARIGEAAGAEELRQSSAAFDHARTAME